MEESAKKVQQYLTFRLAEEIYGVEVSQVIEVLDLVQITRVPKAADFVLGVINLRSRVVPVVDMRKRFDLAACEETRESCIVVLEVELGETKVVVGALADAVEEVMNIPVEQIEPPPRLGAALRVDFIHGMCEAKAGGFVTLLDINKIFSSDELMNLVEAGESTAA